MVTNDDSYLEYPGTQHISFAYENIINGIQPEPAPSMAPEVKKRIDDARKLLYELDEDGDITGKSKLYRNYVRNASDYAQAKVDYSDAQNSYLNDVNRADSWPMASVVYQRKVDDAYDAWKTEGAERVEQALDTIESVGVNMQARMTTKSRKLFDAYNLGLAGVPSPIPYSYVNPTHWYDSDDDSEGWQTLTISSNEYNSQSAAHQNSTYKQHFESHSSSSGGGGAISFGFGFAGGSGGTSSTERVITTGGSESEQYQFHNDATDLSIEITYGLCTIERPWFMGDLFYMQKWYLVNNPAKAISDGLIDTQIRKEAPLLPMVPMQFLVIKNVKIKTSTWGQDGQTLNNMYRQSQDTSNSTNQHVSAGGGISLGFISFGGHGSHDSSDAIADYAGSTTSNSNSEYGWHFDGSTLEIKGTQIIGWLSDILPASPPESDPGLTT
ncbi:hypothetical protein [Spirosoma foliorum]|uniref:Uncharacterized protein n=1 Tax=Spirosoma foliorum TaxID=2710596 RepID=A0A7G5GS90_9BACT|nr:hypothetical protein [Spirosoma foliorum]QMW01732.1 hypothetical protein H3H32_27865 [Spirosoma foliorum]